MKKTNIKQDLFKELNNETDEIDDMFYYQLDKNKENTNINQKNSSVHQFDSSKNLI